MRIREALGIVATFDKKGNLPGSSRVANGFTNSVADYLRNVGEVAEKPNGANGYPSFTVNGLCFQVKTTKGKGPMWNEAFVRPDAVLVLRLDWGVVVVHGSLITSQELMDKLIEAKDYTAPHLRERYEGVFNSDDRFYVNGGRVQFGDNIDWQESQKSFLDQTIAILEGMPEFN